MKRKVLFNLIGAAVVVLGVVAIANAQPVPTTCACHDTSCKGKSSLTLCYGCCNTTCVPAVDCQDCCDTEFAGS